MPADPHTTDREEFEKRWSGLGLDRIESPSATAATIRPLPDLAAALATAESTDTRMRLPRMSIGVRAGLAESISRQTSIAARDEMSDVEIAGVLGEGGMGLVLLAHQRSLGRDVAIKILKPAQEEDPATSQALIAEGLAMGRLEHPNIVPVHALARDGGGHPILVMKRVEGVSWTELLGDADHELLAHFGGGDGESLGAHLAILMQLCNAVHYANTRGVVHRDIKPANVMIGAFGEVYLADWGVATNIRREALAPGTDVRVVGTPAYMAPEMVRGTGLIDERTDVYLLGATLHEILTGQPRHSGGTLHQALYSAYLSAPVRYPASVPAELAAICNRATDASPARRFESAVAFRQAIIEYLHHRASVGMATATARRLDELRALLHSPANADAKTPALIHRLITECRFGFTQALHEWKDNLAARDGLRSSIELAIEHELAQQDVEGARALLAELGAPAPEWATRIENLEAEQRARRTREAQLQAMARDLDPAVGRRWRNAFLAILISVGTAISVFTMRLGAPADQPLTNRHLVDATAVLLAVFVVTVAVCWRRLATTAINRRIIGALAVAFAGEMANRLLGLAMHIDPNAVLAMDMVSHACIAALGGFVSVRWTVWMFPPFAIGAVIAAFRPGLASTAFGIADACAIVALLVFWRKQS